MRGYIHEHAYEASMEPLFFKAENSCSACTTDSRLPASMEPLFFKAENWPRYRQPLYLTAASMEPLFFKAENPAGQRG